MQLYNSLISHFIANKYLFSHNFKWTLDSNKHYMYYIRRKIQMYAVRPPLQQTWEHNCCPFRLGYSNLQDGRSESYASESTYILPNKVLLLSSYIAVLFLTWSRSLSSAWIVDWLQSMTSLKGSSQPLASSTGIHPACSTSRKRKDPRRRPRGTRQKVEFRIRTS